MQVSGTFFTEQYSLKRGWRKRKANSKSIADLLLIFFQFMSLLKIRNWELLELKNFKTYRNRPLIGFLIKKSVFWVISEIDFLGDLSSKLLIALKISTKKVNKTVALQNILPRSALLTIYKSSVRTHLDHGDIIYD